MTHPANSCCEKADLLKREVERLKNEAQTVVKYSIGPEENAAAIPIISELRAEVRLLKQELQNYRDAASDGGSD